MQFTSLIHLVIGCLFMAAIFAITVGALVLWERSKNRGRTLAAPPLLELESSFDDGLRELLLVHVPFAEVRE